MDEQIVVDEQIDGWTRERDECGSAVSRASSPSVLRWQREWREVAE